MIRSAVVTSPIFPSTSARLADAVKPDFDMRLNNRGTDSL
jgi:hypothetical protein